MFKAVLHGNLTNMEDIFKRFKVPKEYMDQICDDNSNSLICMAAMKGHSEMVKLLCNQGLNVDHQNSDGNTALHFALSGSYINCVDILLSNDASEKIQNKLGLNPWELKQTKHLI